MYGGIEMSNYRAGDIIRLTRIAIGMTQEELCENICGVQTLHRIENGKVAVKKETYHRLMEKMNRIPEQTYAVCVGKNMELLEERIYLEDAMRKEEYEKADQYLKIIESEADDNIVTLQYVRKMKALVHFYMGRIDKKQLLDELDQVIRMTVPDYEKYYEKEYPFTEQEILALMSMANSLDRNKEYEESRKIYKMLLRCIEIDYMEGTYKIQIKVIIMWNLARNYGNSSKHEKAVELLKESLKISKEYDYGCRYTEIYGLLAWNMLNEIKSGKRDNKERKKVEQYLRQAYYIAAARRDKNLMQITKNIYEGEFHQEIN